MQRGFQFPSKYAIGVSAVTYLDTVRSKGQARSLPEYSNVLSCAKLNDVLEAPHDTQDQCAVNLLKVLDGWTPWNLMTRK